MEKLTSLLQKTDRFLSSIEKLILIFVFSLMIFLSFLQVILREFFSAGLLWGDIFLRHGVLWIGFLGAAIAVSENKHFAIDFLKKSLPQKSKIFSELGTNLFALIILLFLSESAVKFFKDELSFRSVLFTIANTEIHSFWMNFIIPAGFILMAIHFFVKTMEEILNLSSSIKK